jgi:hypothetical protein
MSEKGSIKSVEAAAQTTSQDGRRRSKDAVDQDSSEVISAESDEKAMAAIDDQTSPEDSEKMSGLPLYVTITVVIFMMVSRSEDCLRLLTHTRSFVSV